MGEGVINTSLDAFSCPNNSYFAMATNDTIPIFGIINSYFPVISINHCSNSVTVSNCSGLTTGNKVLIIQMKGAAIDTLNDTTSGSIINYNNAGNYEIEVIDSMIGCELIFKDSLINSYTSSGNVQLVKIPHYENVNVIDTLKCLKWNGTIGGVLIFEATGTVILNADISVMDKGFGGGVLFTCNAIYTGLGPNYVMPSVLGDRVKGDGISTLPANLLGGRGTIANGGGAGGAQPSVSGNTDAWYNGGGGGGNFGAGGNGGLSSTFNNTQYPGGLGGRSLNYSNTINKIFMGGGGGSGHRRYSTGGPTNGTNGAGIVIIKANTITGNNKNIFANGIDNLSILSNVGRGGGGAGGTVLLDVQNYTGPLNISAKGGKGGDNQGGNKVGPGGGGGGGVIWLGNASIPGNITYNVSGGQNGQWISGSLPWDATPGSNGAVLTNLVMPQGQKEFTFPNYVCSASSNSPVCQGGTINLTPCISGPNTSYLWTGPNGFVSTQQSPVIINANPIHSGPYYLQILINGCPSPLFSDYVIVNPRPIVNAGTDQTIPFGTSTNLSATASGGSGPFSYSWVPASLVSSPNQQTTSTLNINSITQFIVNVQNVSTSCANADTLMVFISGGPLSVFAEAQPNTICEGTNVTLNALVSGGTGSYTFTWSSVPAGFSAGIQSPVVAPSVSTTYIVSVFDGFNTETSSIGVTINPLPVLFNFFGTGSYCAGSNGLSVTLSSSQVGENYQLMKNGIAQGSSVSGTGNALVWNSLTAGTYTVVATNLTAPYCSANMTGVVVIVENPGPAVIQKTNISVCPGSQISIGGFVSNPTGATFTWTNSNTGIGLAASGSGNIASWNAPSNNPCTYIADTITVTPTLNGCTGTPMSFFVTIYPKPTVNQKSNIGVCPGTQINLGSFTSCPSGATFTWTNSNINIGIATSGTGNISSWFAPANNTGSNITGTITVTPTRNGCVGVPMTFTVTIYPKPSINQIANIAVCPGSQINIPCFVSTPTGATFTWTNSNTSIGLAASGSGCISSLTAPTNSTGANIVSTITVTSTLNGCMGTPMSFTVTILPLPAVFNLTGSGSYCAGTNGLNIMLSGSQTGVSYQLMKNSINAGAALNGTDNTLTWTNQTAGIYTITATYTTAPYCSAIMTGNVVITENPLPVVYAGSDQTTICWGSTTLSATASGGSGSYAYHWEPAAFVVNPDSQATSTVLLGGTVTYVVYVTDNATSCIQSDTAKIIAMCSFFVDALAQPDNFCIGDTVFLSASIGFIGSGSYNYTWSSVPGGFNANVRDTFDIPNVNTTYTVWVDDLINYTWASDDASTILSQSPGIYSLSGGGSYCSGDSGLTVTLSGSQTGVYYQLNKNDTTAVSVVSGTGNSLSWNNLTTGSYTVSCSSSIYCNADMTGSVDIVETPAPVVHLGADTTLCQSQNITLIGPSGSGYSYIWVKLPDDTLSYNQSLYLDSLINGMDTSSYELIVSDVNTCSGADTINITFDICITTEEINDFSISVFPNPAKDNLTIAYSKLKPDIYTLDITNMLSQKVYSKNINIKDSSGSLGIDTSRWGKGIYYLTIRNNKMLLYGLKLIMQ